MEVIEGTVSCAPFQRTVFQITAFDKILVTDQGLQRGEEDIRTFVLVRRASCLLR